MKVPVNENFYAPFEQVLIETVIDCFDYLNHKDSKTIIENYIDSQMEYFIEKDYLKEVKNLIIDKKNKEILITCVIPIKSDGPYETPIESEKVLKMSWKNLTKEQVEAFKKKKEEIIKNGITSPNCEIVG